MFKSNDLKKNVIFSTIGSANVIESGSGYKRDISILALMSFKTEPETELRAD